MTKAEAAHPVFGLVDRLRSAIRTGRRLHLDPEHAKVLMDDEVYLALSRLEAREMRRLAAVLGAKRHGRVIRVLASARRLNREALQIPPDQGEDEREEPCIALGERNNSLPLRSPGAGVRL